MDIFSYLTLFGGIGLFLYGMSLVGSSLEKLAGAGLEKILERLTSSKNKFVGSIKGLTLGLGVTAIIQSSAATTVMVVGFVNAGIMKLVQGLPVVMGANIGSTATAYILSLGDIQGGASIILSLLKPSSFAPIIIGIGAFILLISKNKKLRDVASILMGFGILFFGMETMSSALSPLRESPAFQSMFTTFQNPIVGVLIGMLVTAAIQSSSASVGILQILARTSGSMTWSTIIPIIIGQNIGKCITVLLASFGTNKKAKRVVISHLFFNLFGACLFLVGVYGFQNLIGFGFWNIPVSSLDIANFHFLFNFITSLVLLPFNEKIVKMTGKVLHDTETSRMDTALSSLDSFLLNTPTVALDQCKKVILAMSEAIQENYLIALKLLANYDEKERVKLEENEKFIDKAETALGEYILQINQKRLQDDDRLLCSEILNCITDFERMGDHCVSIAIVAQSKHEQGIKFSENGQTELAYITRAVENIMSSTFKLFEHDDIEAAYKIEPLADVIDTLKETIKSHHVKRLQTGDCGINGGIALVDLVTSLERLSSHCSNIALHVIKKVGNDKDFDENGHTNAPNLHETENYSALYTYYGIQYIEPIINLEPTTVVESDESDESDEQTVVPVVTDPSEVPAPAVILKQTEKNKNSSSTKDSKKSKSGKDFKQKMKEKEKEKDRKGKKKKS